MTPKLTEQTIIRSIFIRTEAPPIIEIQSEYVIRRGDEVLSSVLLPASRFDPLALTQADRKTVETALGETLAAAYAQHVQSTEQAEAATAAHAELERELDSERHAHHLNRERLAELEKEAQRQAKELETVRQCNDALERDAAARRESAAVTGTENGTGTSSDADPGDWETERWGGIPDSDEGGGAALAVPK